MLCGGLIEGYAQGILACTGILWVSERRERSGRRKEVRGEEICLGDGVYKTCLWIKA